MKDWEARFANSEMNASKGFLRGMASFSWAALIVAVVYTVLITSALIGVSRDTDPEAQTAGWIIFGLPWIVVCGSYRWPAVPLNAATVYFVVVAMIAAFRNVFQGGRQ